MISAPSVSFSNQLISQEYPDHGYAMMVDVTDELKAWAASVLPAASKESQRRHEYMLGKLNLEQGWYSQHGGAQAAMASDHAGLMVNILNQLALGHASTNHTGWVDKMTWLQLVKFCADAQREGL